MLRALWRPAAEAGIAIPRVREADLGADPAWVIFDVLPGVPVPEAGDAVLEPAWPPFLQGAGADATDPELPVPLRSLQVLRMLELLAGEASLAPEVRRIVADRLRAMLR